MKIDSLGATPHVSNDIFQKVAPSKILELEQDVAATEATEDSDLETQDNPSQPRLGAVLSLIERAREKRGQERKSHRGIDIYKIVGGIIESAELSKGKYVDSRS